MEPRLLVEHWGLAAAEVVAVVVAQEEEGADSHLLFNLGADPQSLRL